MIIKTVGHVYDLQNFENRETFQTLSFIHKEPVDDSVNSDGTLKTIEDGTTNEEVLAMLIDRMEFLNQKMSDDINHQVILTLEKALELLVERTRERTEKGIEGTNLVN